MLPCCHAAPPSRLMIARLLSIPMTLILLMMMAVGGTLHPGVRTTYTLMVTAYIVTACDDL